jgi:prepilin-type N-terminal cleavage/methylation domain-containing protein
MKQYIFKIKKAFTMIELVLVIVVLGILAALAMPRIDRDLKQEAADTILSNIRYAQHLALIDYKHMFNNAKWQQRFWHIVFGTCSTSDNTYFFMLGSDDNMGDSDNTYFAEDEAAIDPQTEKPLFWTNGQACSDSSVTSSSAPQIFISRKYGVKSISSSGSCANALHIGFDHLGRPHHGFGTSSQPNYSTVIHQACTFSFTMSDDSTFSISIQPETGYAQIVDQDAS